MKELTYNDLNIYSLCKILQENKEEFALWRAQQRGDIIEGINGYPDKAPIAVASTFFIIILVLLVLGIALFIWSWVALFKYKQYMDETTWNITLGLLIASLFTGGSLSIVVLIIVYATKHQTKIR
jgi:hypothetical protein